MNNHKRNRYTIASRNESCSWCVRLPISFSFFMENDISEKLCTFTFYRMSDLDCIAPKAKKSVFGDIR